MLWTFDFHSDIPLYLQLRNQVVIGIAQGKLLPGDRLPTIRALAEESGINMMTVSKAYQLLKQEGHITTDRRSGAVVAKPQAGVKIPPETLEQLRVILAEFRALGTPEADMLQLCKTIYREGKS